MKCLVLGGGGFIGSSVVTKLTKKGHRVLVMGRSGKSRYISKDILSEIEFISGDIRCLPTLEKAAQDCDQIFCFAGIVDSDAASELSLDTIETEVQGLQNVCKSALKQDVRKVIYASSCSVYGDDECSGPLTEESPVFPRSHYAVLKRTGELLLKAYNDKYNLSSVILRIFNPYGMNQQKNMVIQRFFEAAINNRPIQIYGSGSQTRDFIYIVDVAKAAVLAGEKIDDAGIINVCTGEDKSIRMVAETIILMTQSTAGCEFLPLPNGRAEAELSRSLGSNKRLQSLMGFLPTIEIEKGLKLMYEDMVVNQY